MSLDAVGVSYTHPNGRQLFSGVDLSVLPGERVAISAPSGAGKTTLCRILAGYLKPIRGCVRVDGGEIEFSKGRPLPVQLLWQQPELAFDPRVRISTSLMDVGDPLSVDAGALLDRFEVRSSWLSRFPHELSGGELMRLCMARALMANPSYLIADEATAMLDAVTQAQLMDEMMRLSNQGLGLVFVSHSRALVDRVATRVFDLNSYVL